MEEPYFHMTVTGGQRILNGLEEAFVEDIFTKPFKGFALELNQSATSLPSITRDRLASKMYRSAVSLASFSGFAKKFACTGVFIKCTAGCATILTSASLVRVSGEANKIDDNLRIEVCLPNSYRVVGRLNGYNLHYNIALVNIMGYWGHCEIEISEHQVTSCLKVVAVGCLFAHRKLMATEGNLLIGKKSDLDCRELCVSTCKITKAGIGGPLIDTNGEFLGMNFYHEEETPFLPRDVIHRLLLDLNKQRTGADVEGDENRMKLCAGFCRACDSKLFWLMFFEPLSIAFESLQSIMVHGFQLFDIWQRQLMDSGVDYLDFQKTYKQAGGTSSSYKQPTLPEQGY